MPNRPQTPEKPGLRLVSDQSSVILQKLDEIVARLAVIERDVGEIKTGYAKLLAQIDIMGRRLDRLERRAFGATA